MALSTEVQDRIKTYLWEVAAYLTTMSPTSRIEVLRDLESHLYEALNARNATPTVTDVDAVLSAMPAPASYGNEDTLTPARTNANRLTWNELPGIFIAWSKIFIAWCRTISWESIVGILLLLFGIGLIFRGIVFMVLSQNTPERTLTFGLPMTFYLANRLVLIFGFLLMLLGIICLVIATFIGKSGMRRIINSNGKLYGFLGAFIAFLTPRFLLYNLIALILIIIWLKAIPTLFILGTLILVPLFIYLNYVWIKYEWRCQQTGVTIDEAPSSLPPGIE